MLPDNNLQVAHPCYGLMRYHSAPSSTLAGLIHIDEDLDLTEDSSTFVIQVEETEFAQFLDDHLSTADNIHSLASVSLAASGPGCDSQLQSLVHGDRSTLYLFDDDAKLQLHMKDKGLILQEEYPSQLTTTRDSYDIATVPGCLPSPILEHGADVGMNAASTAYGITQMKLDAHVKAPPTHVLQLPAAASLMLEQNALQFDGASSSQTAPECGTRTDINMTSFFALSKEAYFHDTEKLHVKPSAIREVSQAQRTVSTARLPSIETQISSLLRQNSLPADLISHVSLDVSSPSTSRKMFSSENSSEEDRFTAGGSTILSWNYALGSQRPKRGLDFHNVHTAQSSEPTLTHREASYYAKVGSGNLTSTEVLCKVSAKRGFATHPRSIAERVRRTKINEGIKKLQQVMPNNMERHTSTVTVLDEAVEYVKYLQQQVQVLSASSTQCRGQCHSEGKNMDVQQE